MRRMRSYVGKTIMKVKMAEGKHNCNNFSREANLNVNKYFEKNVESTGEGFKRKSVYILYLLLNFLGK